jgi:DNA-binding transcriptional regulator PaaX
MPSWCAAPGTWANWPRPTPASTPATAPSRALQADEADEPITPEDAFLLRTLLIHDWRRLLLRDPELPDVLLPAGWPGRAARQLTRDLYRRLLAPSERHLDALLQRADGQALPPPDAASRLRFGGAVQPPASTV